MTGVLQNRGMMQFELLADVLVGLVLVVFVTLQHRFCMLEYKYITRIVL